MVRDMTVVNQRYASSFAAVNYSVFFSAMEGFMEMKLSINTDIKSGTGYPFTHFNDIREAGFSHIHWCHNWNTDFQYTEIEIIEIKKQLDLHSLRLSDIHASSGVEKCWYSPVEYERLAGVELVKNRIYMSALLGGDAIVLHPFVVYDGKEVDFYREQGLKSLRELANTAESCGVKISLENLFKADNIEVNDVELENIDTLEYFFSYFPPEILGFCWDIGHCIILGDKSFDRCAELAKKRLSVMHLNDNRGDMDQHSVPFSWIDRWDWIAEVIAASPYPADKPVLLEVDNNRNPAPVKNFLTDAYTAGTRFSKLVKKYRQLKLPSGKEQ